MVTNRYIEGGGGSNYSTEEQVIGTWIDGKPLYQRVFNNFNGSDGEYIVDTGLSNLGYTIIDLRGYGHDSVNNYSFPYADGSFTVGCYLNNSTGVVTTHTNDRLTDFHVDYICIKYTKL